MYEMSSNDRMVFSFVFSHFCQVIIFTSSGKLEVNSYNTENLCIGNCTIQFYGFDTEYYRHAQKKLVHVCMTMIISPGFKVFSVLCSRSCLRAPTVCS